MPAVATAAAARPFQSKPVWTTTASVLMPPTSAMAWGIFTGRLPGCRGCRRPSGRHPGEQRPYELQEVDEIVPRRLDGEHLVRVADHVVDRAAAPARGIAGPGVLEELGLVDVGREPPRAVGDPVAEFGGARPEHRE